VRHEEAVPRVGVERLDESEHAVAIGPEPADELVLGCVPERQRTPVDVLVHVPHAERIGRRLAIGREVPRREVALGRVDQVADDVAHLPVARRRRRLPDARCRGHREHVVGLLADRSEQVVLAREIEEVPLAHRCPPGSVRGRD
jgi:hypothetical protein